MRIRKTSDVGVSGTLLKTFLSMNDVKVVLVAMCVCGEGGGRGAPTFVFAAMHPHTTRNLHQLQVWNKQFVPCGSVTYSGLPKRSSYHSASYVIAQTQMQRCPRGSQV